MKIDRTGKRFGFLEIVSKSEKPRHWNCVCVCGKKVTNDYSNLASGSIKSCGCKRRELIGLAHKTHGLSRSSEWRAWHHMKQRCFNKRNKDFIHYGGRGISVCSEWVNSFECFFRDMGKKPSKDHTLERKDNEVGYSKENCVWIPQEKQKQNTRRNHKIELNGEKLCIAEIARRTGINRLTIHSRIQSGWTEKEAVSL